MAPIFKDEQLIEVTKAYSLMGRKRADTANYCKLILRLDEAVITAALNEIEHQQLNPAQNHSVPPAYEEPSHEEIDLATIEPEELGLEQFNERDDQLINTIFEAKRKKKALAAPPVAKPLQSPIPEVFVEDEEPKVEGRYSKYVLYNPNNPEHREMMIRRKEWGG